MDNRAIVKQFISERWSDQKIAEVFAFNQDGKMQATHTCCCLIGVSSSENLHADPCGVTHYLNLRRTDVPEFGGDVAKAEVAYLSLSGHPRVQSEIDRILGEILMEIMAEREALRVELSPADVAAIQELTHG